MQKEVCRVTTVMPWYKLHKNTRRCNMPTHRTRTGETEGELREIQQVLSRRGDEKWVWMVSVSSGIIGKERHCGSMQSTLNHRQDVVWIQTAFAQRISVLSCSLGMAELTGVTSCEENDKLTGIETKSMTLTNTYHTSALTVLSKV